MHCDCEERRGHISRHLCLFCVLNSICVVAFFQGCLQPFVHFSWSVWLQLVNVILTGYWCSEVDQIAEKRTERWAHCGGQAVLLQSATAMQPSRAGVEVVGASMSTFVFKVVETLYIQWTNEAEGINLYHEERWWWRAPGTHGKVLARWQDRDVHTFVTHEASVFSVEAILSNNIKKTSLWESFRGVVWIGLREGPNPLPYTWIWDYTGRRKLARHKHSLLSDSWLRMQFDQLLQDPALKPSPHQQAKRNASSVSAVIRVV